MKKSLDSYQQLLVACVFGSVLFAWYGSGLCVTVLDQIILVVFPMGFMLVAFVVRRFSLFDRK